MLEILGYGSLLWLGEEGGVGGVELSSCGVVQR